MRLGFVLGVMCWLSALNLGIWMFPLLNKLGANPLSFLLMGGVGAWLAVSRAKVLLWSASTALCILLLLVILTPWSMMAARSLVRDDPLQKADAIYVLGYGVLSNGQLPDSVQVPLIHAYELLGQGYAPRLVVARLAEPHPSALPAIRRQMKALRLHHPVQEVGPVMNTYEEAVKVSELTKQQGWKRVILIGQPTHMWRAKAVFMKAGVPVLASPGTEGTTDLNSSGNPGERMRAFGGWVHEVIGYQVYRLRGRI